MALAAMPSSRSPFPREPTWEDAIVPALRKRLETESQALAKRMSAASTTSADGYAPEAIYADYGQHSRNRSATPTSLSSKPSAIPRPSVQQSRTADSPPSLQGRSSRSDSFQRSRTFSQPFPFDPSSSQSPPPMPPDSTSRANSPMVSGSRVTRIPVSRARTGSTASSHQPMSLNGRGDSRSGFYKASGNAYPSELTSDSLWPVDEGHQPSSVGSRSTLKTLPSQVSDLVNQQPPFDRVSSRRDYDDDYGAPRMSSESEERPFEHWYRGDVSRNGGVGELRVGRKQEMLDIANYGHTLRQATSRTAMTPSSRSRSNSRGRDEVRVQQRRRADSVGARDSIFLEDDEMDGRDSIFMDGDDKLRQDSLVLDERPLTDLDSDDDGYDEGETAYYGDDAADHSQSFGLENRTVSPHSLDRSDTPTLVDNLSKSGSGFKSRIPTPTPRQISEPPRTTTPTQTIPKPSTPKMSPSPGSAPPTPKTSTPTTTTTAKRKAKSPAPTTSTAKRTRAKPTPKPTPKKEERSRDSAQYPAPEGDDIMHAVPSWTQPVPPSGNWDDVVLPVVARKKGLEGYYQQADGSPKPKPVVKDVIAPAPGTFGIDHSKYRGRNRDSRPEAIQMDEFGQRTDNLTLQTDNLSKPETEKAQPPSPLSPPSARLGSNSPRAESPAPFSQYPAPPPIPEIRVTRPSADNQNVDMQKEHEDEPSGGCCKCVIM